MKQEWIGAARIAVSLIAVALIPGPLAVNQTAFAQADKPKIAQDSEYYILDAQHGEQWAVEDKDLDQKLAELRQKYGAPPNIIHILFDDTPVGEPVKVDYMMRRNGEGWPISDIYLDGANSEVETRLSGGGLSSFRTYPAGLSAGYGGFRSGEKAVLSETGPVSPTAADFPQTLPQGARFLANRAPLFVRQAWR
ncbi:MAG: hypothetical protein JOZ58_08235 [Acetobacteraceae bacterium]|nr:hypothetical protein [Acetobacteraceae bacterium]